MKTIKVSEATGVELDWLVAKCEDRTHLFDGHDVGRLHYSTDWSQGGPIIDHQRIWLKFPFMTVGDVEAIHGCFGFPNIINAFGPTALVAAMRCYVTSKLGDTVEVPDDFN